MAKARAITFLNPHAPTAENARVIVRERLADMYALTKYIDDIECIQELHDLRIAAKRVRYTLEVFEEFLPAESKGFVEELAALQDELGELHDSEVMLGLLRVSLQHDRSNGATSSVQSTKISKPLVPPNIVRMLQKSNTASPLQRSQREGLGHFLRGQEQRREQCYAAFRQHWARLEQQHFRESLLKMLIKGEEKE